MKSTGPVSAALVILFGLGGVALADPPKAIGEGEGEVDIVAWPG